MDARDCRRPVVVSSLRPRQRTADVADDGDSVQHRISLANFVALAYLPSACTLEDMHG
jgi:hypothetical protein